MTAMLVFRSSKRQDEPNLPGGLVFRVHGSPWQGLSIAAAHTKLYGLKATFKMLAKVGTRTRFYYTVVQGQHILSDGWILAGRCSSYPIGARDFVIGPIYTVPEARGRGLAHAGIVRGINFCLRRGGDWVYIDTTEDNAGSRRAIEKSGMELLPAGLHLGSSDD
jgi:hypothetical protein